LDNTSQKKPKTPGFSDPVPDEEMVAFTPKKPGNQRYSPVPEEPLSEKSRES